MYNLYQPAVQIFTAQVKKSHYFALFRNTVCRFTTYYILPLVQVGCGLVGAIRVIELVTMRKKKKVRLNFRSSPEIEPF